MYTISNLKFMTKIVKDDASHCQDLYLVSASTNDQLSLER
jgi:hypothetical protein